MISARRILTIVGTLFTALAAGFMMQYIMESPDERAARGVQVASIAEAANQPTVTDAVAEDVTLTETPVFEDDQTDSDVAVAEEPATDLAVAEDSPSQGPSLEKKAENAPETPALTNSIEKVENVVADAPTPPAFAPQPAALPEEPVKLASLEDIPVNPAMPREEPVPAFECDSKVVALTAAGAMVELLIDTNCHVNSAFTVHHNGMMVSGMTDGEGLASVMLPALAENAVYMVTFPEGDTITASAEVTSVPDYDRAIVQWSAYDGLQVHALEYGATYDEPGHVWSGAQGDILNAAKGEGGFMIRAGEATPLSTHMVEVYTFPTGTALKNGTVALSLEAVVTDANCGKDLRADVLQKSGDGAMVVRELTLAMPDCDAIGDFLVLNNMFDDLNIARN